MIPIMLVEAFIIFLVIYNMVALKKEATLPGRSQGHSVAADGRMPHPVRH